MNTNATLLSISHQIPSHIPYRSRNTELCLEENFLACSSPLLSSPLLSISRNNTVHVVYSSA